jgi:hypothetical protein
MAFEIVLFSSLNPEKPKQSAFYNSFWKPNFVFFGTQPSYLIHHFIHLLWMDEWWRSPRSIGSHHYNNNINNSLFIYFYVYILRDPPPPTRTLGHYARGASPIFTCSHVPKEIFLLYQMRKKQGNKKRESWKKLFCSSSALVSSTCVKNSFCVLCFSSHVKNFILPLTSTILYTINFIN